MVFDLEEHWLDIEASDVITELNLPAAIQVRVIYLSTVDVWFVAGFSLLILYEAREKTQRQTQGAGYFI